MGRCGWRCAAFFAFWITTKIDEAKNRGNWGWYWKWYWTGYCWSWFLNGILSWILKLILNWILNLISKRICVGSNAELQLITARLARGSKNRIQFHPIYSRSIGIRENFWKNFCRTYRPISNTRWKPSKRLSTFHLIPSITIYFSISSCFHSTTSTIFASLDTLKLSSNSRLWTRRLWTAQNPVYPTIEGTKLTIKRHRKTVGGTENYRWKPSEKPKVALEKVGEQLFECLWGEIKDWMNFSIHLHIFLIHTRSMLLPVGY